MKEVEPWHEHRDAVAGALLILGSMLCEWQLPLNKAVRGLRLAYRIEKKKQSASSKRTSRSSGRSVDSGRASK